MNNYYRFYQAVWVGRVTALSTDELYKAIVGLYYKTDDSDLSLAISDLAYNELSRRGEMKPRGSRVLEKLVGQAYKEVV